MLRQFGLAKWTTAQWTVHVTWTVHLGGPLDHIYYGNLERPNLRLWTIVLDCPKIRLWTVILERLNFGCDP